MNVGHAVTLEFTRGQFETFWTSLGNCHITDSLKTIIIFRIYWKKFSSNFYQMVDLIIDERSDLPFPIAQETFPWQPILGAKSTKLAYSPSFVALVFRHRLEYRNSDLKILNGNDFSMSFINLVRFGLVSSEFTRLKFVQQISISTRLNCLR